MRTVVGAARCTGTDRHGAQSSLTILVSKEVEDDALIEDVIEALGHAARAGADDWGLREFTITNMQARFVDATDEGPAVFHID